MSKALPFQYCQRKSEKGRWPEVIGLFLCRHFRPRQRQTGIPRRIRFLPGFGPWRDMLAVGCAVLPGFGPGGAGLSSGMAPFDPESQPIPVRGCISVAWDSCARGPNPREGIHGSPRITRICTCNVCGILQDLRAICSAAGHRWFFEIHESV